MYAEKIKEISFSAKNMKHPLLTESECIANDFSCGEEIVIITGSNMSGKSSFMRMIGVNLVLMYAGAYVNAEKFCAPFMRIFTSIGVQDDISRGISTFYGELLRIKKCWIMPKIQRKMRFLSSYLSMKFLREQITMTDFLVPKLLCTNWQKKVVSRLLQHMTLNCVKCRKRK